MITDDATGAASAAGIDMKLEVVVLPVSNVDRAKAFYAGLGWRLDADIPFPNGFRVVQFTPGPRQLPDRQRHRGGASRSRRARRGGQ
jgi:catechol 2,3-dioxygenase-like lactoylglutathione lyase family enzyme